MRIVVFGASGRTGREVVEQAVAAGHGVIAVTRRPAGYDAPAGVDVRAANVLEPDSLRGLFLHADAVVSAVGSDDGRRPTTVYSDGVAAITAEMRHGGANRLVVLSAVPVSADGDKTWFERLVLHPVLWRFFGASYTDLRAMESELATAENLEWAVVRPPRLTDQPPRGSLRSAWNAPLRGARTISRRALARVLLQVATAEPFRGGVLTVSE